MFDYAKFQNAALAAVAAIIFTTVSVGAAVGPARQIEKTPAYLVVVDQGGKLA